MKQTVQSETQSVRVVRDGSGFRIILVARGMDRSADQHLVFNGTGELKTFLADLAKAKDVATLIEAAKEN